MTSEDFETTAETDAIWRLVEQYCEETISEADLSRLEELLASSSDARRAYWRYMGMHGRLLWEFHPDAPTQRGANVAEDHQAAGDDSASVISNDSRSTPSRTVSRAPASSLPTAPSAFRKLYGSTAEVVFHPIMLVLLLAMVSGGVLAYTFWSHPITGPQQVVQVPTKNEPEVKTPAVKKPARSAAVVTRTTDARWHNGFAPGGTSVAVGKRLKLAGGFAEIKFDSQTTIVVEAPAELEIVGHNGCALSAGKLVAQVPAVARGFAVQTPTLKIVDLGTEFGVSVTQSEIPRTEVHVLLGEVTVQPASAEVAQAPAAEPPVTLKAGEAVTAKGGSTKLEKGVAKPDRFVRQVPSSDPQRLIGHWPLDGNGKAAVGHDTQALNLEVTPAAPDRTGAAGRAVGFRGDTTVAVIGGGGLDGLKRGTISLFVKWQGKQPPCAFPGAIMGRQQAHGGWLDAALALSSTDPTTAVLYWRATTGAVPLQGKTPVGDQQWRHVAVTFGPDAQDLYLDGRAEAHGTGIPDGMHAAPDTKLPMTLGGIAYDAASSGVCVIDDVKIFDRELTAAEIKALALEAGNGQPTPGSGPR